MRQVSIFSTVAILLGTVSGCSSLGLSLWPSQFPLLRDTKAMAAQSPMPSGLPSELAKHTLDVYYIEPGDRVLIEPVEVESELQTIGDQKVQVDGSIDLGRFGRLRVAGMPVEAIEIAVEDRIGEITGQKESINVQLIEPNAAEVYVLGEVGSPGAYALDGHETVLDAILTAGGLTSQASPCDIVLVRPTAHCDKRVVLPLCYRQITQLGDTTTNYQVQPGDRIVVGARTLREELAVWRQTAACPRCNCEQRIECRPDTRQYMNRFVSWVSPFPLPRRFNPSPDTGDDSSSSLRAGATIDDSSPADNNGGVVPETDNDLFLPSLRNSQSR